MSKLHFKIEQIALCPKDPGLARQILADLGLTEWSVDNVFAYGEVYSKPGGNVALLQFNYQAGNGTDEGADKPLELEVLHYEHGPNWMQGRENSVSHLGMHVTAEQLLHFRSYFESKGIRVAQEVFTKSHTNPHIATSRRYNYCIFDTHQLIGVDLKFIVRMPYVASESSSEGCSFPVVSSGTGAAV